MSEPEHEASTASTPEREQGARLPKLAENPAFVERMSQGWGVPDRSPALPEGLAASTAGHRRRLSEAMPDTTMVVCAGAAMLRNDDEYFPFRADSDYLWLVGCPEPHGVLVLDPHAGGHDATLYLPEPVVASDAGYLTERERSELWMGGSPTLAEWQDTLGVDVRPLGALAERMRSIRASSGSRGDALHAGRPGPAMGPAATVAGEVAHALGGAEPSTRLGTTLSRLRLVKDDWEIAQLQGAVDASVEGFAAVARELPHAIGLGEHGNGERWLAGTFDRTARTLGNAPGYRTIVAAGSHAPILHWTRTDGPIRDGELLLLDAGVEARSFYTADVTRTLPIGGTFSDTQRIVHDVVQRSHEAGMAAVSPGASFTDFHHAAMEVIARALDDWGILPVSVDEALEHTGQHHRRYLICGIGHHLGLDVHDCSKARHEHYHGADLEPGMVLTVEPGLYFHAHDESVPPELRGIGVRIEDDLLVTQAGARNLSDALPRDAAGLESWVAQNR